MATSNYHDVLRRMQRLSSTDQLRLLAALAQQVADRHDRPVMGGSLLTLEGLGKEVWEGVNPQEFVDRERDAWDG